MENKRENIENSTPENKSLSHREIKKWIWVLLSLFLAIQVVVCSFARIIFVVYHSIDYLPIDFSYEYNEITEKPEELGFDEVKDDRVINMALFGVDTRKPDSFKGLSDSIMILSVNTATKKIKLISVMRDSLVPIEKNGNITYNKINSAYSTGGPELALKTINTIFDLDISEYVTVNFFKLADIIDAVGGVEVTLTQREILYVNAGVGEAYNAMGIPFDKADKVTSAGKQHLNGIQAVAYARIRYTANSEGTANDYGRTDRQRLVMKELYKKVKVMSKSQYLKLIKPILSSCETSLSYSDVIDAVLNVLSANSSFGEMRVPEYSYLMASPNAGVGSVVYYDLEFAAELIHSFIYDDISPDKYIKKNGVKRYNWFAKGFKKPEIKHSKEDKK